MKSGWNIHYKYSEVYDTIDIIDYVGYDSIIYDDTSFFFFFFFFSSITAPQLPKWKESSDWSVGDNCIPSAKYRV